MKRLSLTFFLATLILSGCSQAPSAVVDEISLSPDVFVFEETEFDFGILKQSGGIVEHEFGFTYTGEETLTITGTPGSCACTTGSTNKDVYEPGESGVLTVRFDPNLHAEPEGRFFKTVIVVSEPAIEPLPEVRVWQEIDLDLGEEFFTLKTHDDGDKKSDIAHSGSVTGIPDGKLKEFSVEVRDVVSPLADGVEYEYWSYEGTVPGPFMRVREGDMVRINLKNAPNNEHPHSIDLHAVNGPGGGAVVQVYPGEEKSFEFRALNPGVYVYHCATPEVAEHIANGMYGLIVVEPRTGFSRVDREYYIMQGEFYTVLARGDEGFAHFSGKKMMAEQPDYFVFNGRVDALTGDNALRAKVGEKVRLFVGNGGVADVSNFHIIGEVFDTVYPEGGTPVIHNVQTTLIPAGGATIVEFTVDVPGKYKIVDHALARLNKGAYAELIVEGEEQPDIFKTL